MLVLLNLAKTDDLIFALQIYISKKWGFTKWDREVYEEMRANGKLQPDGVNVQVRSHVMSYSLREICICIKKL